MLGISVLCPQLLMAAVVFFGGSSGAESETPPKVQTRTGGVRLTSPEPPGSKRRQIATAVSTFRTTGKAEVIERSDTILFPYGESQPVFQCTPLRACDIELQAGEIVTGVALGDTERWVTSPLESGSQDAPVPHVIVKPKTFDLSTNIVIGTDRRTYHLTLVSPSEADHRDGAMYVRRAAFYYPQDIVETWVAERSSARRTAARRDALSVEDLATTSLANLDFSYTVGRTHGVTWAPDTVFDDGQHVYIRMPAAVTATDLPSLLLEIDGGGMALGNYRVNGRWFVVDGLFTRAQLVAGVGKKRKIVVLYYRGDRAEASAK